MRWHGTKIFIMNDSPPAFTQHPDRLVDTGMKLRDYFAAAALQGMLANPECQAKTYVDFAEVSYRQADAMLEARSKN